MQTFFFSGYRVGFFHNTTYNKVFYHIEQKGTGYFHNFMLKDLQYICVVDDLKNPQQPR